MAGYSVAEMVTPKNDEAHIEAFFTKKQNTLYCILPRWMPQFTLQNFTLKQGIKASLIGSARNLAIKQSGNDCIIDLSHLSPADTGGKLFVIKLENAL